MAYVKVVLISRKGRKDLRKETQSIINYLQSYVSHLLI